MGELIPRFIELRGCVNCDTYQKIRKEGFHHETIIPCMLMCGTLQTGYSATNPFIDPEELMEKAKETGNQKYIENAEAYVSFIKRRFGKFYESMDINLDDLFS